MNFPKILRARSWKRNWKSASQAPLN